MHRVLEAFFSPHAFRQVLPDVWNGFVHGSQRMAARSLGLSYGQALRHVVLPQAVRRVIPPLLNDFVGLQKDTAIISVAGVTEATIQAQNFSSSYFNFTGFVVAGVLFIFLPIALARFTDHLIRERELRERALAGRARPHLPPSR